jgi:hypothetical protein
MRHELWTSFDEPAIGHHYALDARITRALDAPTGFLGGLAALAARCFSSALARCSFLAAASTSVRLVAASSSASASRSFWVQ